MAQNFRKLVDGINIVPKTTSTANSAGDLDFDTTANKLNLHNGTISSPVVTEAGTATLTNKTIAAGSNTISGLTNSNLSGSAGITGANIASATIANSNLANMAGHTYKGNNTGSSAAPADITSTQLTADLNVFTSSLQGLAPSSGGGTTNFLRADGTWAAPSGTSGVTSIGTIDTQTKSANGAVISGSSLIMQTADSTHPGLISSSAQTIAGDKTFTGFVATSTLEDTGGGLTIITASNQNLTIETQNAGRMKFLAGEGFDIQQISTPSNPGSGYTSLYFKSDNLLYSKTSSGVETLIGAGISGTEWKNDLTFTPSAGFGTTTANDFFYRRVGDSMQVRASFAMGTVAASTAYITLPATYSVDTGKIGNKNKIVGYYQATEGTSNWNTAQQPVGWMSVDTSAATQVYFANITNSSTTQFDTVNANAQFVTGNTVMVEFTVPISGWTINNGSIVPNPIPITNWTSASSIISFSSGFGTVSPNNLIYRRVGDTMEVMGNFTPGTIAAATAYLQLSTYTIDTSKLPTNTNGTLLGETFVLAAGTANLYSQLANAIFYDGSTNNQIFFDYTASTRSANQFLKQNATTGFNSTTLVTVKFCIPITQWAI